MLLERLVVRVQEALETFIKPEKVTEMVSAARGAADEGCVFIAVAGLFVTLIYLRRGKQRKKTPGEACVCFEFGTQVGFNF